EEDNTDAFVSSLETGITDIQKKQTELEKEPERRLEVERGLGFTEENVKKIQELNTEISQKAAEFKQLIGGLEGRGIPHPIVAGKQNQLKREMAVEIGVLNSERAALQGNLKLAQDFAERTVKLEFEPIRRQITNAQTFLRMNQNIFTAKEKNRAEKIKILLGERNRQLKDEESQRRENYRLAIAVAKSGGEFSEVDFSRTPEENLKFVGGFLETKNKKNKKGENNLEIFRDFLKNNPDSSEAEIKSYGFEKGLSVSQMDAEIEKIKSNIILTPTVVKDKILKTLQNYKGVYNRAEAQTLAENQLKTALGLNKDQSLPETFIEAIKDALVEVYGRTFFQKILPGGR
ncbi:MAG: hypothetical protein AAB877_00765, partial [Patescibacteria group bacterium]